MRLGLIIDKAFATMIGSQRRSTQQRQAVIDAVRALHDHPTADRVFFEVRKRLPSISLGTVYRNLNILVEAGTVAEISTPENVRRYDGNTHRHGHVVCTRCGAVADIRPPAEATEAVVKATEFATGYRVDWHRLEFRGVCPNCASRAGLGGEFEHAAGGETARRSQSAKPGSGF